MIDTSKCVKPEGVSSKSFELNEGPLAYSEDMPRKRSWFKGAKSISADWHKSIEIKNHR